MVRNAQLNYIGSTEVTWWVFLTFRFRYTPSRKIVTSVSSVPRTMAVTMMALLEIADSLQWTNSINYCVSYPYYNVLLTLLAGEMIGGHVHEGDCAQLGELDVGIVIQLQAEGAAVEANAIFLRSQCMHSVWIARLVVDDRYIWMGTHDLELIALPVGCRLVWVWKGSPSMGRTAVTRNLPSWKPLIEVWFWRMKFISTLHLLPPVFTPSGRNSTGNNRVKRC